ncbi:uncharacterized protein LOC131431136 [Malaya genurostris]|uniref:uncharacterized protein LOC131431136 n=1 Tax=Malaya genurostris TaxID=325434 RepID=UPI0026F409E2|nr:uncharacterized protein LOC131431136 [Malaya genurostris]
MEFLFEICLQEHINDQSDYYPDEHVNHHYINYSGNILAWKIECFFVHLIAKTMFTNHQLVTCIRILLFSTLQFFGLVPLEWSHTRKRFFRSWKWLLTSAIFATFATFVLPIILRPIIKVFLRGEWKFSSNFILIQISMLYLMIVFSYVQVLRNVTQVEFYSNVFMQLFHNVIIDSNHLERKLLIKVLLKFVFIDVILHVGTFIMSLVKYPGITVEILVFYIVDCFTFFQITLVGNIFQATAIFGSMSYRCINQRIAKTVAQMVKIDKDRLFWNRRKAEKVIVCRELASEIDRLSYYHRIVHGTVCQMIQVFGLPVMLMMLYYCIILLTSV